MLRSVCESPHANAICPARVEKRWRATSPTGVIIMRAVSIAPLILAARRNRSAGRIDGSGASIVSKNRVPTRCHHV